MENFVSASIFGDGSAAVILGCPPFLENEKPIYEVQKSASFSVKDTMDKMYWNITSKGWRLGLSKDIPLLIHDYVYPFAKSLLGHLEISNVEWVIILSILFTFPNIGITSRRQEHFIGNRKCIET